MNIRKTIRHIFGLDLFGVPSVSARKEPQGGYRDTPGGPSELERLRAENKELNEKLRNTLRNWRFEVDRANDAARKLVEHAEHKPYLERIEALRQALADIVTGNANPGAAVPDAYMIRANDALKADDKAAKSAGAPSLTRTPSWATDTPPSWSK